MAFLSDENLMSILGNNANKVIFFIKINCSMNNPFLFHVLFL